MALFKYTFKISLTSSSFRESIVICDCDTIFFTGSNRIIIYIFAIAEMQFNSYNSNNI